MFTFLRRIRLRLLGQALPNGTSGRALSDTVRPSSIDSGSVRKYLLYATGEVLLVMIGILLALQVNNWNEWRKDRVKEQRHWYNLTMNRVLNETQRVLHLIKDELQGADLN